MSDVSKSDLVRQVLPDVIDMPVAVPAGWAEVSGGLPTMPEPEKEGDIIKVNGRLHMVGKNGKRWPLAPMPHYQDLAAAMSTAFYGRQPLNEEEQRIYELVLPILMKLQDDVEDQWDEPNTYQGGVAVISMDAEGIAYAIAEIIVEDRANVRP